MMKRMVFVLTILVCSLFASAALAAVPTDFSYRGVALGDTEARLLQTLGEPIYDRDIMIRGVRVKQYTFAHDLKAAVSQRTHKVVDLTVGGKDFVTEQDIRYGALPHKIEQVYGRIPREQVEGKTYYIYKNPAEPMQRLLLEMDSVEGYLLSMHWTSLPITDEEADSFIEEAPAQAPVKLHLEMNH